MIFPKPYLYAGAGAVALALFFGGYAKGRSDGIAIGSAQVTQFQAAQNEALAKQLRDMTAIYEQQRQIVHDTQTQIDAVRRDADNARTVAERLRGEVERLAGHCTTGADPGASRSGQTTGTTGDLLAYVQQRIDEAAGTIAEFADRSRIAGLTCERVYNSIQR